MARPEKITYELIAAICEDVAQGFSFDQAALNNGISASTFFRWRQKGLDPNSESIYHEFVAALEIAAEFSESEALQLIRSSAKIDRNWKAAAWFLERRFPKKYARRHIQMTNNPESSSENE